MNNHFKEILKIMDAATIKPDGICFSNGGNILIIATEGFAPDFITELENYCTRQGLLFHADDFIDPYYLIYLSPQKRLTT